MTLFDGSNGRNRWDIQACLNWIQIKLSWLYSGLFISEETHCGAYTACGKILGWQEQLPSRAKHQTLDLGSRGTAPDAGVLYECGIASVIAPLILALIFVDTGLLGVCRVTRIQRIRIHYTLKVWLLTVGLKLWVYDYHWKLELSGGMTVEKQVIPKVRDPLYKSCIPLNVVFTERMWNSFIDP